MRTVFVLLNGIINLLLLGVGHKRFFSVAGIFTIMWTVCLSLSCCSFWGINTPSWNVVLISCFSMWIFTINAYIKIRPIKKITNSQFQFIRLENNNLRLKHYGMIVGHIIAYLFALPYLQYVLRIFSTGNLYLIRSNGFEGNAEFATTATLTIFQNIICPMFVATIIIAIIDIANKSAKKSTILFAIIDVALYTTLFAGRYMLFETLIFSVFILYDFSKFKSIIKFVGHYKKTVLLAAFLVSLLILVSLGRSAMSFFESLYIYFCGSFTYLSELIQSNTGTDLFLLGKAQFGFIYNLICMIGTYLFGFPYNGSNFIITQLTASPISIGGTHYYNSLGTFLHDLMADYGIWGSLFGVFVFARLCHIVEFYKKRDCNYFYYCVYYYLLFVVVNTVLGYSLRSPSVAFILLFCCLFSMQKKVVRDEV